MPTTFSGWRQILLDQIDSKITRRIRRSVGLNVPPELHAVLMRAARERGISMTAYIRRAGLAFAAHDLGLNWDELMKDEPGVREYGMGPMMETNLAGRGYGNWQIASLRGEYDPPAR